VDRDERWLTSCSSSDEAWAAARQFAAELRDLKLTDLWLVDVRPMAGKFEVLLVPA
jgi:hypothetical protein